MKPTVLPQFLAVFLGGLALLNPQAGIAKPKKGSAKAAEKPAPSAPAEAEPKTAPASVGESAYLRFWKGAFRGDAPVRVQLTRSGVAAPVFESEPIGAAPHFTEYVTVPAGAAEAAILVDGQPAPDGHRLPCPLRPGTFTTLVLTESATGPHITLRDDAPAPEGDGGELSVENFAPNLTEFHVRIDGQLDSHFQGPAGALQMRGLKRETVTIETTAKDSAGTESTWSNELDFKTVRKASLLIHADPYGRIRPRVFIDAVKPEVPAAAPENPQGQQ